jgi:D-glycero-D-manno-heptose 1,7-bisphosphate phosphatase
MKALFLDRDGVINSDVDHLYRIEDLEIFPGIFSVLKKAQKNGYLIIVITNQAGIAKGYYTENDYTKLKNHIDDIFEIEGVHIDATYHCPHHPEGKGIYRVNCVCRKPGIGMIECAKQDFKELDLAQSILVGDKESDIQAGLSAGIGRLVLVRSGHLIDEKKSAATEIIIGLWKLNI